MIKKCVTSPHICSTGWELSPPEWTLQSLPYVLVLTTWNWSLWCWSWIKLRTLSGRICCIQIKNPKSKRFIVRFFFLRPFCSSCPHRFFHIFISSHLWCASRRSKRRPRCICGAGKGNEITVTSRPVITEGNWQQQQQQQAGQRGSQLENQPADVIRGCDAMFHVILVIHWLTPSTLTPYFRQAKGICMDFIMSVNNKPNPDEGL